MMRLSLLMRVSVGKVVKMIPEDWLIVKCIRLDASGLAFIAEDDLGFEAFVFGA